MTAERISKLSIINFAKSARQEHDSQFDAGEILSGTQSQADKRTQNSCYMDLMFVICVTVV